MMRSASRIAVSLVGSYLANAVVLTAMARPVEAQAAVAPGTSVDGAHAFRWSISIASTFGFGGSHHGIESSMEKAGLVPDPGGCLFFCSPPASGLSMNGGGSLQLGLRRAFSAHSHARLLVGQTDLKTTTGFEPGHFLSASRVVQEVRSVALMAGVNTAGPTARGASAQLWAGAGPALHQPRLNGRASEGTRAGLMAAIGARIRIKGIILEPQLDYRLVGSTTTDSLPATFDSKPRSLSPARVSWSHIGFSLGTGLGW